jgi:allantoinase
MSHLVIRSRRVLLPEGVRSASVHVRGGVITAVSDWSDFPGDGERFDAGSHALMPGLVDTHVHVNEPGRTDWEGFHTATRAAAAGGVTTLFDMPLNSIPATTNVEALDAKRDAARDRCWVNVGLIGGLVPGNAEELRTLHDAGVRLFKCFLVPSGVDEFPNVSEADLRAALPILAGLNAPLLVHAELPEELQPIVTGDVRSYAAYLASRPDSAETEAVRYVTALAEEYGARVHVVHLTSHLSLSILADARLRGVRVSAETCPHYLAFAAEEIGDGATQFKCAPPIRDRANRDALWKAVQSGEIEMITSDHSPCPPAMKELERGDFFAAWGGISSLQLALPAVWTMAREQGAAIGLIAEKMSAAPAALAGLAHRKGRIAPGFDADLVVWDPDATFTVDGAALLHRHPLTPYQGLVLHGVVHATVVGGTLVYRDGDVVGGPMGQLLT